MIVVLLWHNGVYALSLRDVKVTDITEKEALITWDFAAPETFVIEYGLTSNSLSKKNISAKDELFKRTKHSVMLGALKPGENYFYRIIQSGTQDYTKVYTFRTKGVAAPRIITTSISNITYNSAEIYWTANTKIAIELIWTCPGCERRYLHTGGNKTKGVFILKNLTAETPYYFTFSMTNARGETAYSKNYGFQTREINYAKNAKLTGTFTRQPDDPNIHVSDNPISLIADDSLDYLSSLVMSEDCKKEDQYIIFDLQTKQDISRVHVFWRSESYSKDYSLLWSNDNKQWNELSRHLNPESGESVNASIGAHALLHKIEYKRPVRCRYIKLIIPAGSETHQQWHSNSVQLYEVKILPPPADSR